jgi:hypothetical protein
MTTVREITDGALMDIGAVGVGETPSAEDRKLAYTRLQWLLQEWSDGGLAVPSVVQEAITLVGSQSSYTVGENGSPDLSTVRPEQIIGAFIRDSSGYDHHIEVIGEKAYRKLSSKTTESRPKKLWYNATAPNGTVYVWPTPSSAEALWVSGIKPFSVPASQTENILNTTEIPSNYHNPIKWNLMVELCAPFEREPTMLMISRAQRGYDNILSLNLARRMQPAELEISPSSGSGDSILTG